ncbi:uncharacterized protein MYCFIDRAFT_126125 [Pseudocercospora fijiensis CIRAD86]|uniref:Uncharacterized protein n=1 Tax=Pseudocercospora fijiensis (strain CIRAD86) TaxID=383855 RepID=N1Q9S5_PSEFD|nr:uncharacterized protein MYCFIDRAFT_126125 [Pseudocercospora fijiensis CIRAD86]EME87633.1 hypothetical protein MYCFIDRAFT_126125 [Pseudocercospora fijiensis CIRAD86]
MSLSPPPPFTAETAYEKVKKAQDRWNTKSAFFHHHLHHHLLRQGIWRNREDFFTSWARNQWGKRERLFGLRKVLFAFTENRIAVQVLVLDAHDGMKWKRCYGLEDCTFAEDGRMRKRQMSGNDIVLDELERWDKDGVDVNEVDISEAHW